MIASNLQTNQTIRFLSYKYINKEQLDELQSRYNEQTQLGFFNLFDFDQQRTINLFS